MIKIHGRAWIRATRVGNATAGAAEAAKREAESAGAAATMIAYDLLRNVTYLRPAVGFVVVELSWLTLWEL